MSAERRPASILIVDDKLENLRLLSGMLAVRGFDVRPVTRGAEALEAVAHEPPDLVLLDVNMPEMTGFEVCARLRENAEWCEIPVIFLTALTDVSDKVKGFAAGGRDYITKPFQIEEVLARVDSQLALRRARRELTESLAQLRRLERLRDDLVHMVVHDMRSPLMALSLRLEQLKSRLPSAQEPVLEAALAGAVALKRMAETLLDVSRLEAGQMPLDRRPCDLTQLAAEVAAALGSLDARHTIELHCPAPVVLTCDAGLIRRVLENLVSNAVKHTPGGGRVQVGVGTLPGGRARITVQDEGDGVPADARQRIFEKFGTVSARREASYHSAGLGLAFCKLAAQEHGGTIGVESADPRGSLFWVELPG